MRKILIASLLVISLINSIFAQAPLRVEIEAKYDAADYMIVPLGKSGLVQFNETTEKAKGKNRVWSFTKYDTDFKEMWSKDIDVERGLDFVAYKTIGSIVYVLLSNKNISEITTLSGDFQIVCLNTENGKNDVITGRIAKRFSFAGFVVEGNTAMFGGTSLPNQGEYMLRACVSYLACGIPICFGFMDMKRHPYIQKVDLMSKTSTPLAINHKGSANCVDIGSIDKTQTLNAVIYNKKSKKESKVFVKEYDLDGRETNQINLNPQGNNIILNGKLLSSKAQSEKFLAGTFSLPKKDNLLTMIKKSTSPNSFQPNPSGIYLAKFNGADQEYVKYYKFSDLKSFFAFTGNGKSNKTLERTKKQEAQGKETSMFAYQFLFHDAIDENGQKIIIAEAYYPQYHYETYYGPDGRMYTRRVFDGYRYTHALILGFDKDGELMWDNCFEINDVLTFEITPRVKLMFSDASEIVLAYSLNGSVKSKVISGSSVVDGKSSTPIQTDYGDDKVRANWNSDMTHWYDNYFLAYGFQRIKNTGDGKKNGEKKRRTVFYFNKIAFN